MPGPEVVFVVNVSSFTDGGFLASTRFEGVVVDLEFDDKDEGVFLTRAMASRLGLKKGDGLTLVVEDGVAVAAESIYKGAAENPRISNSRAYYAVGRDAGAIVRLRKS